MTRFKQLT